MKTALAILLLVSSALAQDHAAIVAAESACGPAQVSFSAIADGNQHPNPQPDPDKALVFVIGDLGQCTTCTNNHTIITNVDSAVVKVGVDGSWMGANRGNSYLYFDLTPGEHHLCVNWQSRWSERAHAFAMANLNAEAGKVYYFRARLFPGEADFFLDLDATNSDQGKYLVASTPYSVSHPKK